MLYRSSCKVSCNRPHKPASRPPGATQAGRALGSGAAACDRMLYRHIVTCRRGARRARRGLRFPLSRATLGWNRPGGASTANTDRLQLQQLPSVPYQLLLFIAWATACAGSSRTIKS